MATPPRVDLYSVIHKALRRELFQTGSGLASTNFADPAARAAWVEGFRRTMGFVAEHAKVEDGHIETALREADEALATSLHEEHQILGKQESVLGEMVTELERAEGMAAVAVSAKLHLAYHEFLATYLGHLAREESAANEAFWSQYSDEELAGVRAKVQGEIAPPRFAKWLEIMLPAINHQERVGMLSGMKLSAPPEVFERVSGLARGVLGDEVWAKIESALPSASQGGE